MQRKHFFGGALDHCQKTLKTPELLLPASLPDKMRAACDCGTDAVYAGQPRHSLRARNNELRLEQIQTGIRETQVRTFEWPTAFTCWEKKHVPAS